MKREEELKQKIDSIFQTGRWQLFPRDFLFLLKHMEAIQLSYLINVNEIELKSGRCKPEGWFKCSSLKMKDNLVMTNYQCRMTLQKLERMGIIERKMIGDPAKRWFRIDYPHLKELMREAFIKKNDADSQRGCSDSNNAPEGVRIPTTLL